MVTIERLGISDVSFAVKSILALLYLIDAYFWLSGGQINLAKVEENQIWP